MSKWIAIDSEDKQALPESEGVYVLYLDGALTYVGESFCLKERLYMHLRGFNSACGYITKWGFANKVLIKYKVASKVGESAMHERRLILKLKPTGNVKHSKKISFLECFNRQNRTNTVSLSH